MKNDEIGADDAGTPHLTITVVRREKGSLYNHGCGSWSLADRL